MVIGLFSLTIGNVLSAAVACWILNGGYTTMYYGMGDKGYLWWFLQWPVIFIYQVQPTTLPSTAHMELMTPFESTG